jgi:asparagine synthase (glutamine-hydrolysing)
MCPSAWLLSGGVDSGSIAALASESGARIEGITVGFEEFTGRHDDETFMARSTANHYGLPHHVRVVSRAEFEHDIPRILDAMDQPSIDGVNTWFASKAVAECGYKVVLSGIGGDELFCGYPSFRQVPRMAALGRVVAAIPGAQALLQAACAALAKHWSQPKLAGVPQFMASLEGAYFLRRSLFLPAELPSLLGEDIAREGLAALQGYWSPPYTRGARNGAAGVGMLESTLYLRNQLLRDSDWASMAHSVELRTPLVDVQLLASLGRCSARFKNGIGKSLLARAPEKPLLDAVVNRPKTGFGVPMSDWISTLSDPGAKSGASSLSASQPSWARRWARSIVEREAGCE